MSQHVGHCLTMHKSNTDKLHLCQFAWNGMDPVLKWFRNDVADQSPVVT